MTEDTSNPAARPSQGQSKRSLTPRERVARLGCRARVRWFQTLGVDFYRAGDRPENVDRPIADKLAAVDRVHLALRCCSQLVDLIAGADYSGDGWHWADQFPADVILAHLAHIDGELVDLLRSCEGVIASEINDAAMKEEKARRA